MQNVGLLLILVAVAGGAYYIYTRPAVVAAKTPLQQAQDAAKNQLNQTQANLLNAGVSVASQVGNSLINTFQNAIANGSSSAVPGYTETNWPASTTST